MSLISVPVKSHFSVACPIFWRQLFFAHTFVCSFFFSKTWCHNWNLRNLLEACAGNVTVSANCCEQLLSPCDISLEVVCSPYFRRFPKSYHRIHSDRYLGRKWRTIAAQSIGLRFEGNPKSAFRWGCLNIVCFCKLCPIFVTLASFVEWMNKRSHEYKLRRAPLADRDFEGVPFSWDVGSNRWSDEIFRPHHDKLLWSDEQFERSALAFPELHRCPYLQPTFPCILASSIGVGARN